MAAHPSYHEHLLHWIWDNQCIRSCALCTTKNREVVVYEPGTLNASDGPDFLNARIGIGGLTFHGDVEIHWSARDWYNHGHHNDPNYNRVVLHVLFDGEDSEDVLRSDQTGIPALVLKPYLNEPLQHFINQYRRPNALSCSGNLTFISARAFEKQIAKAHREYFEIKTNELLRYYDPSLPISAAWQKMTATALFDGLGIMHNREPMRRLAGQLFPEAARFDDLQIFISHAHAIAGISGRSDAGTYRWKRKGCRPNNHPRHRIAQGCEMILNIINQPLSEWLRTDIPDSFKQCTSNTGYKPGLGTQRAGVLLGTVWIPALYILADFLAHHTFREKAYNAWLNHRVGLPPSISKPFEQAPIPAAAFRQKLGTVHQWKRYCRPRRCDECEVFKDAISS